MRLTLGVDTQAPVIDPLQGCAGELGAHRMPIDVVDPAPPEDRSSGLKSVEYRYKQMFKVPDLRLDTLREEFLPTLDEAAKSTIEDWINQNLYDDPNWTPNLKDLLQEFAEKQIPTDALIDWLKSNFAGDWSDWQTPDGGDANAWGVIFLNPIVPYFTWEVEVRATDWVGNTSTQYATVGLVGDPALFGDFPFLDAVNPFPIVTGWNPAGNGF